VVPQASGFTGIQPGSFFEHREKDIINKQAISKKLFIQLWILLKTLLAYLTANQRFLLHLL
jgi:hypothetical protein